MFGPKLLQSNVLGLTLNAAIAQLSVELSSTSAVVMVPVPLASNSTVADWHRATGFSVSAAQGSPLTVITNVHVVLEAILLIS